jgi:hypothetical protein
MPCAQILGVHIAVARSQRSDLGSLMRNFAKKPKTSGDADKVAKVPSRGSASALAEGVSLIQFLLKNAASEQKARDQNSLRRSRFKVQNGSR